MVEPLQPVMRVIALEERRQYIPSDVMGIVAYMAYRKQRNASAPVKNQEIKAYNENATKYGHPLRYEIRTLPEDTVLMISDKTFIITLEDYTRVSIPKGIFECPVDLADHWYMTNHGVKKYNMPPQMTAGFQPLPAQLPENNTQPSPPQVPENTTQTTTENSNPATVDDTTNPPDNPPSGVAALKGMAAKKKE